MESIEKHIEVDKKIVEDPTTLQARRHAKEELHELEVYAEHHKEEIAGDHHDPNALELFCDMHPDEPECWFMTTNVDSALLKTNFVGRDGFIWWI